MEISGSVEDVNEFVASGGDRDESKYLSLVVGASTSPTSVSVRLVTLQMESRDDRNSLLRGLRCV